MPLLGSPKLLILDEPTNGLDPAGIQEMRDLIANMPAATGATVLISSHLLFQGSLRELQRHSRGSFSLRVLQPQKAAPVLKGRGIAPRLEKGALTLPPLRDEELAGLVRAVAESGAGVVGLTAHTKTLEEIFLSLTQTQEVK